jgi:hypothetical protein
MKSKSMIPTDIPEWEFSSRRGGFTQRSVLWLYPEINLSSCVDDVYDEGGEAQLEYWASYVRKYRPEDWEADAVSILWCVEGPQFKVEFAPFAGNSQSFLDYYTWPVSPVDGARLNWFKLPVIYSRFPEFGRALGWTPAPFQLSCPIRSILMQDTGF